MLHTALELPEISQRQCGRELRPKTKRLAATPRRASTAGSTSDSTRRLGRWVRVYSYSNQGQTRQQLQPLGSALRKGKPSTTQAGKIIPPLRPAFHVSGNKKKKRQIASVNRLVSGGPTRLAPDPPASLPETIKVLRSQVWLPARNQLIISLCGSKPQRSALPLVACELGWMVETRCEDALQSQSRAHVIWVVGAEDLNRILQHKRPNQRVSRIAGMHALCMKAPTAYLMRCMQQRCPSAGFAAFSPETWVVPTEKVPSSAFKQGPLIFKPNDGAQGTGVSLVWSQTDLDLLLTKTHAANGAVVQKYIDRPMLLDGYKFDLRLYVFVLSLRPLRVFLCREGLVRVCSDKYEHPVQSVDRADRKRRNKNTRHLTNYSLNKYSNNYSHRDDPSDGSHGTKRTLSSVMKMLGEDGIECKELWNDIKQLVGKTTEAMASACTGELDTDEGASAVHFAELWHKAAPKSASEQKSKVPNRWSPEAIGPDEWRDCFHILGFDVIIEHQTNADLDKGKLKPLLLEVNCNPSLGIDAVHTVTSHFRGETTLDGYCPTRGLHGPIIRKNDSMLCPHKMGCDSDGLRLPAAFSLQSLPLGCARPSTATEQLSDGGNSNKGEVVQTAMPMEIAPEVMLNKVASGLAEKAANELDCVVKIPSIQKAYKLALHAMRGKGVKVCRCASHVKPHLHRPCLVDLVAKRAAIGGALLILTRDIACANDPSSRSADKSQHKISDLLTETDYEVIHYPTNAA